jgi:uncharacterized protein YbaP (TraB family)
MAGLDPAIHFSVCRGLNFPTQLSPAAAAQQLKFQNCKRSRFPLTPRNGCIEGLRRWNWGAVIFRVILMAAVLFFLAPARADDPPITDWSQVETVVVQAKAEGPAFWHVTKGNSEGWILGTIDLGYDGMNWEGARLRDLIHGSRGVILQPEPDIGFISAVWFTLTYRGKMKMPDGQKLDDLLKDDMRQRFHNVVDSMGIPASKYDRYVPFKAASMLIEDYQKSSKLSTKWLAPAVDQFAGEAEVKTTTAGEFDLIPAVKELLNKPPQAGLACFSAALESIEYRRLHAIAAANAWAKGDIASLKEHYFEPTQTACLSEAAGVQRVQKQIVGASVASIHDALETPGRTVVLISIGNLLRRGGVLDRLHDEGLTVEGPAE